MSSSDRPKELLIDESIDHAIDISLRRLVYGTLAGGAVALLLFSKQPTYASSEATVSRDYLSCLHWLISRVAYRSQPHHLASIAIHIFPLSFLLA